MNKKKVSQQISQKDAGAKTGIHEETIVQMSQIKLTNTEAGCAFANAVARKAIEKICRGEMTVTEALGCLQLAEWQVRTMLYDAMQRHPELKTASKARDAQMEMELEGKKQAVKP
jgi:plasmid maintenance system antidote protein VapI